MAITTNTLTYRLTHASDLAQALDENEDVFVQPSVSEYLKELCEKYKITSAQLIRGAHIERTYGYQILNGTRNPSRDKLLQLAFGLGLSLEETQNLLKRSGKSPLYAKVKRDAVCMFGLSHGLSLFEVQELLTSVELPLLGEV